MLHLFANKYKRKRNKKNKTTKEKINEKSNENEYYLKRFSFNKIKDIVGIDFKNVTMPIKSKLFDMA